LKEPSKFNHDLQTFFRRDQKAADKNIGASGGDGDNRKFRVSSGAKAPLGKFAECRS
jgi:hypothetical protein